MTLNELETLKRNAAQAEELLQCINDWETFYRKIEHSKDAFVLVHGDTEYPEGLTVPEAFRDEFKHFVKNCHEYYTKLFAEL